MSYVVYLTIYRGNKLPPFYIGYTTREKVTNGYGGTIKSKTYKDVWKQERRESPHLFKTKTLQHFNTVIEAREREEFLHRHFDVPNNPMYINMGIGNGKFGFYGPHLKDTREKIRKANKGHTPWIKGKHHTEETKRRIGLANSGKNNHWYGVGPWAGKHHTEKTKETLREFMKGSPGLFTGRHHTEDSKQKMSISAFNRPPDTLETRQRKSEVAKGVPKSEIHRENIRKANLGKHPTEETKRRISEGHKGQKSWNKGKAQELATCLHCGKIGGLQTMKRWHFDKCKLKDA